MKKSLLEYLKESLKIKPSKPFTVPQCRRGACPQNYATKSCPYSNSKECPYGHNY